MGLNVLIGLLFACTVAVSIASPVDNTLLETNASPSNDADFLGSKSDDLSVFDDDGIAVLVDLDATDPETIEETREDLANRVHFYLYTKHTEKNPELLHVNDTNKLSHSRFDPTKDTIFVTHGWMNSRNSKACTLVRDAFLEHSDCNVIVIDWGSIAKKPYTWSSDRVPMVAQFVSSMVNFLLSQGMNPLRVTIVGHCLGGHVAGLSAHYANQYVSYVVALDPTGPNFLSAASGNRVSRNDANYVEVIHTNAGFLGYKSSIGHADFFPNGGKEQNGCAPHVVNACSHARSYQYFAESINSETGFMARKCNSYSEYSRGSCNSNRAKPMGGFEPKEGVTGDYYLDTLSRSPYAKALM